MHLFRRIINILILLLALNTYLILNILHYPPLGEIGLCLLFLISFIIINIFPSHNANSALKLRSLKNGYELIVLFEITFVINLIVHITIGALFLPLLIAWWNFVINIILCLLLESILLVNGISRVYATSIQLGIKWRLLILAFWWVPIANIILLHKLGKIVRDEYKFETEKKEQNIIRKENKICATKYPILLVHGVFFRDFRFINYWGRIPQELVNNGATIYYGDQQSAASVKDCALELKQRIETIVEESRCEKVNIIAHSKGGLDARCAISCLGMDQYVASLTTINTPHYGCAYADYLINKAPVELKNQIAKRYNAILKKFGDKDPDFLLAVNDLTEKNCTEFNNIAKDMDGVYYQSVASAMKSRKSGRFPLNMTHAFVKHFDGDNDGLVSVKSAKWGDNFILIELNGSRGISHGDVIDLNRENIKDFDIREFYVNLVKELKEMSF